MTVTTELVLIRHGETDWNKEHRLQGQAKPGPPLNEMGILQTHMVRTIAAAAAWQQQHRAALQQGVNIRTKQLNSMAGVCNAAFPLNCFSYVVAATPSAISNASGVHRMSSVCSGL
jgi:hypothetical protein